MIKFYFRLWSFIFKIDGLNPKPFAHSGWNHVAGKLPFQIISGEMKISKHGPKFFNNKKYAYDSSW